MRLAECVTFWSFVEPEDLARADGRWDSMIGVFAVATQGRVIVGKVSDQGYEDQWTYETEDVSLSGRRCLSRLFSVYHGHY